MIYPDYERGRTALNSTTDGLIHITIPVGMLQCNLLDHRRSDTREALVIDPGDEVTRILDLIGRHKLIVKVIVSSTHTSISWRLEHSSIHRRARADAPRRPPALSGDGRAGRISSACTRQTSPKWINY